MSAISPQLAKQAREAAARSRNDLRLSDWIWALNLEADDNPIQLRKAALILREMRLYFSRQSGD